MKKIEKVNKSVFFKPLDIAFYAIISILIIVLLCVFLIPKNENTLEKIEIYKGNEVIYTYDYNLLQGNIEKLPSETLIEEYDENNCHYVKIITEESYNLVEIGSNYALMKDANCSHYAPCVNNFSAIKKDGDIIVCMPHQIKIVGVGNKQNSNEVRI
ncbi:MAG: NusG domain II-containing protein [Clostridia bacterium]